MSTKKYANRKLDDKAKIFPTSIVKNGYKNLFGGNIFFWSNGRFSEGDGKAFVIEFYSIPQEVCIELATRDWRSNLGLVGMAVHQKGKDTTEYYISNQYLGNCTSRYKDGEGVICANDMPLPVEQAARICGSSGENYFTWKFY